MKKNKWFKHYNSSHQGQTILELWNQKNGPEAIAFYWTILEFVSLYEEEEKRGFWEGNLSIFKAKLGMNRQRSRKLLEKIGETFEIEISWKSSESFQLFIPKWLELQELRGGKREAKKEQNPDRSKKREVRSKKIEDRSKKEELINIPEGGQAPARSPGAEIWEAYQDAYRARYGVDPVRNATTNSQCSALHKRLGESAIEVVRFYLTHNDGWYLRNQHPIGACLSQAESLHTQMQRGVSVTSQQVRVAEKTINNAETLEELRKEWGAK